MFTKLGRNACLDLQSLANHITRLWCQGDSQNTTVWDSQLDLRWMCAGLFLKNEGICKNYNYLSDRMWSDVISWLSLSLIINAVNCQGMILYHYRAREMYRHLTVSLGYHFSWRHWQKSVQEQLMSSGYVVFKMWEGGKIIPPFQNYSHILTAHQTSKSTNTLTLKLKPKESSVDIFL